MRITVDLAKASTETLDLTSVLNPRVGDGDLKLPFHITYGESDYDMRGKSMDFLAEDSDKKKIHVAGTVDDSTKGDDPYTGNITFTFPKGTFKTPGTYDVDKTMFRIVNEDDDTVISTVNVRITILANDSDSIDPSQISYDSRMEAAVKDFSAKGKAALDDAQKQARETADNVKKEANDYLASVKKIADDYLSDVKKQGKDLLDDIKQTNAEAKGNVAGDTAATAKQAKQQANTNAGNIHDLQGEVGDARGRFMTLSDRENKQDFNIERKEDKANANANYAAQDLRNDQQDKEIAKKASQSFITDYLSNMYLQPEAFENEAALKAKYPSGEPGIMVTVDTGHKWIWSSNKWADCGVYQVAGDTSYNDNRLIVTADDIKAPYDDLDTLPGNSTVTYAGGLDVQNKPSTITQANFTIHTYWAKKDSRIGATQVIYTDGEDDNSIYYRSAWGDPDKWSDWQVAKNTKIFTNKDQLAAPYDSLNTLPAGSVVSYEPGLLTNDLPYTAASQGYTVITSGNGFAGKVQDVVLSNGGRFHRISWGYPAKWSDWQATSTSYVFLSKDDIKAPFDDLDTLPGNSTVTYLTGLLATDFPYTSDSQGYTITTSGNGFAGKVQTVTCENRNRFYRISWGYPAKWSDWQATNSNHIFISKDQLAAPYDNLDLLPSGSVITYVKGLPDNDLPFEKDPNGYTIVTYGNGFADTSADEIKAGQVQIVISANGSMYHRIAWGAPAKWGSWQDDSYTSKMKYENLPSLAIFTNFAVIGDSYSKGYIQKADGTVLGETDNKWGQFMANQYGTKFTDLSVSGQNTRKFVDGYLDQLKQTKADTYFIALGINDASPDNKIELGSLADVKGDSSTNAQTFYGDYARIIDTIKQTSPNSKIVLFTIMTDWGLRDKFDPAIKSIGNYYNLPVVNVLDDQYFSSPLFSTLQSGGHPTVPGYGLLATHLMKLIQKCVVDNPDYFKFLGVE